MKTRDVEKLLGVGYYRLFRLVRVGHIPPPAKDSSGDYVWSPEDIERARQVLHGRRKGAVTDGEG